MSENTKYKKQLGAALGACLLFVLADLSVAQPPPIVEPIDKEFESTTFRLLEQLRDAADEPNFGDHVHLENEELGHAGEPWSDVLQVTREDNPLVTDDCRLKAIQRAEEVTGNEGAVKKHLTERFLAWKEAREGNETVNLDTYFDHLKKCQRVCGPYVAGILRCHVEAVQNHPHMVVYFEKGRPRDHEDRGFPFTSRDRGNLKTFAERMKSDGKSVMVLSRASILNQVENYRVNQGLAGRRANAVIDLLRDFGFPDGRVQKKVLTWEPPRLDAYEMAALYGLKEDWARLGNKQYMDQSVVIVGY